ncbi:A24 family peptidase [Altericroceibacterium endophyticum]|uniref:Peptidase n=1 Tax=Altericroceibacterium endophyticum TaxID=1808508 RepID=A0A6I4T9Q5_9SPHN|nr:prepilin peptidase [Altericroceibacterium endophyticum]MXO66505.1 peptidase [Altericroceibacterium endophyticum]
MTKETIQYGLLLILAIGLLIAAFTDLRSRRIGNWLNGAIALGAPVFWWSSNLSLWPDIAIQIGLMLVTLVVLSGLFALRAMGGGDVKLLTALALWISPIWFLKLVIITAIAGGVLTIIFGAFHVMRRRKDRIAIPYGVAIAFAGLWVLAVHYFAPLTPSMV